jgi:hypothetical protein
MFRFTFLILSLLAANVYSQSVSLTLGPVIDKKTVKDNFDPITPSGFLYDLIGIYRENHHSLFDVANNIAYMGTSYTGAKYYQIGVLKDFHTFTEVKKLSAEFVDDPKTKIAFASFAHIDGRNFGLYGVEYENRDEYQIYVNQLSDQMALLGSPLKVVTLKDVKAKGKNFFVIPSPNQKQFLLCRIIQTKRSELQSLEHSSRAQDALR